MYKSQKTNGEIRNNIAAIIVAAGYSSRMKAFKPLLPLGKSTVVDHAIHTFLDAGITNIVVVLGYQAKRLKPVLEEKNIQWVYNEHYSQGMYSSIVTGVKALPSHIKGFFLLPVDIPLVQSNTITHLLEVYVQSKKDIIYPTFGKRKGHPPLISSCLFSAIRNYNGTGGLKTLLRKYEEYAEYVEVDDKGVLWDMDEYNEYKQLYNKANKGLHYSSS